MSTDWLRDAVIYEIYPQSYADSDGDGIGDLRGVIDRLDHIASLGVDCLWFNPCFDSPFVDAGYDVADYLRIAPRYGTNDDLVELVAKARERGIRVLLDLVVGHTSIEHPWFVEEAALPGPHPEGDRYIWRTDEPTTSGWEQGLPGIPSWVPSPGARPGWYLRNFYDQQPALNFGWRSPVDGESWRATPSDPGPQRNLASLREIISFWCDQGVAGFRVDMAFSLVKDYDMDVTATASTDIWRELTDWMAERHPEAVLLPEGSEPRVEGERLAFHADFFLVIHEPHSLLFDTGYAGDLPWTRKQPPYFGAEGQGSATEFVAAYDEARAADPDRLVVMASADHDFDRLRCGDRGPEQLGAALTFLLTWGTVPSLYYGDEIGMRYLRGMPDVEGAVCHPTYNRAGCRTPMQWDDGPNAGFSTADPERLYLPIDPDADRPTVAAQEDDPRSTLNTVRALTRLRRAEPALRAGGTTEVVHDGYPLAYVRGGTHLVVVNPRREPAPLDAAALGGRRVGEVLLADGVSREGEGLSIDGFGWGVLRLAD